MQGMEGGGGMSRSCVHSIRVCLEVERNGVQRSREDVHLRLLRGPDLRADLPTFYI